MTRMFNGVLLALAVTGMAMTAGCSKTVDQPATDAPVAGVGDAASNGKFDGEEYLASLSAADRAAVLAQKVCPVSGEPLWAMDTPSKVTIDGKDYWVCCAACIDPLKNEPEKYLAALAAASGAAAEDAAPEADADAAPAADGETAPAAEGDAAPATADAAK
jgi:YHS domain-containing protein